MRMLGGVIVIGFGFCWLAAGCSSEGGAAPALAAADGTVTFNGSPLAGATVTFFPEKGPLALAVTDMNGKFTLATGTLRGCALGPAKATVSAFPPGENQGPADAVNLTVGKDMTAEATQAREKKMAEMTTSAQKTAPKSLVPERYLKAETSGLSYTIEASGNNHFQIDLKS